MTQYTNPSQTRPSRTRPVLGASLIALTTLLLAGCGTNQMPDGPPTQGFSYVRTVDITTSDTVPGIEARFDGKVVTWHPEAGFAVIGTNTATQDGVDAQGKRTTSSITTTTQTNTAVFAIAEGRVSAYAGGRVSAYAGGAELNQFIDTLSAWDGGWWGYTTSTSYPTASANNLYALTGGNILFGAGKGGIHLSQAQALAPRLGQGIKVAVIDTGVDLQHPGLKGVAGDAKQPAHLAPSNDWKDYVDGDAVPQETLGTTSSDGYGHGTGVAGVVLQVAPSATIMPIRVLGPNGSGDATAVASAIEWAVNHGAKVINLSLGTATPVDAVSKMIAWAVSNGVFVVASSGNSNDTAVTYPAAEAFDATYGSRLVGVGSVGSGNLVGALLGSSTVAAAGFDQKSVFSTYGPKVEMFAPGELIATLIPGSQTGNWTGTSFAAPMVSGALALALGEPLTATQLARVPNAITATADSLDASNPTLVGQLGKGRLNVEAFMRNVLGL